MYKNAKKPKPKGASAMQPAAKTADGASSVKLLKGEVADRAGPVNDEKWWKRRAEDVPVDQVCPLLTLTHYVLITSLDVLPQILHA